jgi:hypothetical protein
MRSDTDSGIARFLNGCELRLHERAIAIRQLPTLLAVPSAASFAVKSLSKRHCAYQGGWS